jgi:hypothetical protein
MRATLGGEERERRELVRGKREDTPSLDYGGYKINYSHSI